MFVTAWSTEAGTRRALPAYLRMKLCLPIPDAGMSTQADWKNWGQAGEAGELRTGALRWWRLLNENWNNGEQKQTPPQRTDSTWENVKEHQTGEINRCTRLVQCVNSGLWPLLIQTKSWEKKCTGDKRMTQALTDFVFLQHIFKQSMSHTGRTTEEKIYERTKIIMSKRCEKCWETLRMLFKYNFMNKIRNV